MAVALAIIAVAAHPARQVLPHPVVLGQQIRVLQLQVFKNHIKPNLLPHRGRGKYEAFSFLHMLESLFILLDNAVTDIHLSALVLTNLMNILGRQRDDLRRFY